MPVDLSGFETVFCDSEDALRAMRADGLRPDAMVRSASPWLLGNGCDDFRIEQLETHIAGEPLRRFKADIKPLAVDLYDICRADKESAPYARTVARASVLFQRVIIKVACLEEADFREPRLHIRLETGDARHDRMLNAPWDTVLAGNPAYRSVVARIEATPTLDLADSKRLRRWMHQGVEYFGYRAGLLSSRWFRRFLPWRGIAFILRENELVFETAYHLWRRGVRLERLRYGDLPEIAGPVLTDGCVSALGARLDVFLREHLCEAAIPVARAMTLAEMEDHARRQRASDRRWSEIITAGRPAGKRAVVLTNYPGMPEEVGLFTAAERQGVPVVGFQHGVSRELNAVHGDAGVENSAAHLTLVYNETAKIESDRTPFAHWPTVAVGYPQIGRRIARLPRIAFVPTEPVLFVSTNVYRGNTHMVTGTWTDAQTAEFETRLIRDVLQNLPRRVTYKSYPYLGRYADPDPAMRAAEASDNLSIVTKNEDMRYLIRSARVVVTCRASSTTGWCLMSDRPLVFINVPDQMPLSRAAKQAFSEALFLFEADDPALTGRLRTFLSRPLEDIEAEWAAMAPARARLIGEFIDVDTPDTGSTAAKYLLSHGLSDRFFDAHAIHEPARPPVRVSAATPA
ncbi:MAG: hypothetical protein HOL07_06615 [Rhodospirillaceae bacterium]|jgi:hypothetical protein|nr:hypothetical protein [Rhodospirillaceae bacterium]MBT3931724.1 hypothetical protein [Rhodospirillaceae bacterium]MBT4773563.1 hypothetical protein [Rhodospirillaceae bacterium]MBT5358006.1 hypothetical protein [Rhodospirillaceae bacterium]MBT5768636.1 hypothetical protein [Rhodospirillaceae bacterium]